ncbi:btk-binding protein-related [Anaeramoeba flamelloides]|uniref:Btk-binding protein-related n=1 Tax=Anaeramoeba flamelloides TaxID=1746091 RepID=A0AAV7Z2U0_9EUKA|nr:btk-binding protein-related [Anaeramoeba flamelloides]
MNSDIFISGSKKYNFLIDKKIEETSHWDIINKIKNTKKIVTTSGNTSHPYTLALKTNSELELHSSRRIQKYFIENEKIKDIVSGIYTFLILTESGKVYSLAEFGSNGMESVDIEIPFSDPQQSHFNRIRLVNFFIDNNFFVESIKSTSCTNYFLCKGNKLYGSGKNNKGQLGNGTQLDSQMPILLFNKVEKVFSCTYSYGFFYTSTENQLFASGNNYEGQLGLGHSDYQYQAMELKNLDFEPKEVLDLKTSSYHSILITKEGKIYSCGYGFFNGLGKDEYIFTEIPFFKKSKQRIIKIETGPRQTLILTINNELYGLGISEYNFPTKQNQNQREWDQGKLPQRIQIPDLLSNSLNLYCGFQVIFIYNSFPNILLQDFENFVNMEKFTDFVFFKKRKAHTFLLESRIGSSINQIEEVLNQRPKKDINAFLDWIYFTQKSNNDEKLIKDIFTYFNLRFIPEDYTQKSRNLEDYFLKLYNDEESKDFYIQIIDDENEDEDEESESDLDEQNFNGNDIEITMFNTQKPKNKKIYVHKFILLIRSGLFRGLFEFAGAIDHIKDYSRKSIESLEILIKYFYTDKIELSIKNNPILIIEELNDAIDYYQLNENSNLTDQLKQIQKKFL